MDGSQTTVETPGNPAPNMDIVIQRPCPNCAALISGQAALVEVPHFKEVAHLILDCSNCNTRTETFKSGHRVEEKGQKITVTLENMQDLERKVLKGEYCTLEIPLLGLELPPQTLPARFMPILDFLHQILEDVLKNATARGEASNPQIKLFHHNVVAFATGKVFPATILLDDPAGNTHVESFSAPDVDANIKVEEYARNEEQEKLVMSSYDTTPI
ncbi:nucleolar zinc-finger protein [Thoreauomyces humboldtii]|nr:nucleolar zinc-finger protein [Thoreauomyces humboldtii]